MMRPQTEEQLFADDIAMSTIRMGITSARTPAGSTRPYGSAYDTNPMAA